MIGRDYPRALTNPAVPAIVQGERRILITNDRDFGDLVIRRRHPLSSHPVALASKIARLDYVLTRYHADLDQSLVVRDRRVRVRRR